MSSVRPCHNARKVCEFCNTSMPVPETCGSSVRLPYPYPESTSPTEHNLVYLHTFYCIWSVQRVRECQPSDGGVPSRGQRVCHVRSLDTASHASENVPVRMYLRRKACVREGIATTVTAAVAIQVAPSSVENCCRALIIVVEFLTLPFPFQQKDGK